MEKENVKVRLVAFRKDNIYVPIQYGRGIVKNLITGKWYFQLGSDFKVALVGDTNYDLFKEVISIYDRFRIGWRKKKPFKRRDNNKEIAKKFLVEEA